MTTPTQEQIQAYLVLTGYREDQTPKEKQFRKSQVTEQKVIEAIEAGYV
jgi:hypothetical protein